MSAWAVSDMGSKLSNIQPHLFVDSFRHMVDILSAGPCIIDFINGS
jgi:hypothetical protein